MYIDESLHQICDDKDSVKSTEKLTLQRCLYWCDIEQRKRFCMWNYDDNDGQTGFCIGANDCQNRSTVVAGNEAYRTYIDREFNSGFNSSRQIVVLAVLPRTRNGCFLNR